MLLYEWWMNSSPQEARKGSRIEDGGIGTSDGQEKRLGRVVFMGSVPGDHSRTSKLGILLVLLPLRYIRTAHDSFNKSSSKYQESISVHSFYSLRDFHSFFNPILYQLSTCVSSKSLPLSRPLAPPRLLPWRRELLPLTSSSVSQLAPLVEEAEPEPPYRTVLV